MSAAVTPSTGLRLAPRIARTRGALARELIALRAPAVRGARSETIAFVPTMGALHDGHRALLRHARGLADHVVVSVFVNPLQFGPDEDLERYPRTWDDDLLMCEEEGVELVFAPSADVIYPEEQIVTVSAGAAGDVLEGAHRPGHFDGVLTVVCKLLNLVSPDVAVFGEKDAQQLLLVRRMVQDLGIAVHIVGHPTIREPDGVAMSSRNRYLDDTERAQATALARALFAAEAAASQGAASVARAAREVLADAGLDVDYCVVVDPQTLQPVPETHEGQVTVLIAAHVGATRLIDNLTFVIPGA